MSQTDQNVADELFAPESWRAFSRDELRAFMKRVSDRAEQAKKPEKKKKRKKFKPLRSALAVRTHLRPVDLYCYLKARFGLPNGFQTFLKPDDSDALIHWDYHVMAGDNELYFVGFTREIHVMNTVPLTDLQWRDLLRAIKREFSRIGSDKSAVQKTLERWVILPNKFLQLAKLCADLHAEISELVAEYRPFVPSADIGKHRKQLEALGNRAAKLYGSCVQLALLTPILVEAFLNLLVLMLCKSEIRDDAEKYQALIKQSIHTKILELHESCEGFVRGVDQNGEDFKNFMRVRDKRNDALHGNIDPEIDKVDEVFFEDKTPLFKAPGDNVGMFWAMMERRHAPAGVLKDYEDMQLFLAEIAMCLHPDVREAFEVISSDSYPGYDLGRKKMGKLFPDYVVGSYMQGTRYDDELEVDWGDS